MKLTCGLDAQLLTVQFGCTEVWTKAITSLFFFFLITMGSVLRTSIWYISNQLSSSTCTILLRNKLKWNDAYWSKVWGRSLIYWNGVYQSFSQHKWNSELQSSSLFIKKTRTNWGWNWTQGFSLELLKTEAVKIKKLTSNTPR